MALNAEWERHFSSRFLVASRNFRSKDRFNETEDCTEGFKPKYRIIERWDLVGVVRRHPSVE